MAKVAREACEQEFVRMCQARRIKLDRSGESSENQAAWQSLKNDILDVLETGELVIDENSNPVYTPPSEDPITFHRATGATFMAIDGPGKDKDVAKLIAVITELTKSSPGRFSKMDAADYAVCASIAKLFLSPR